MNESLEAARVAAAAARSARAASPNQAEIDAKAKFQPLPRPQPGPLGSTVTKVSSSPESVVIHFGADTTVSVDLGETGYNHEGPEAMELHSPGDLIVVWR